jgi:hypothetical protein
VRKESQTEIAAKALARAGLTDKGRREFSDRYWREAFAARERKEYRRQARFVMNALKK